MDAIVIGTILVWASTLGTRGELVPHYPFDGAFLFPGGNPFDAILSAGDNVTRGPKPSQPGVDAPDEKASADNHTSSSKGTWWLGGAAIGEDVCYSPESPEPYFW